MRNLFDVIKFSTISAILAIGLSGCISSTYDNPSIAKAKPISNAELAKMNVDEFYKFMEIKYALGETYTYADAYDIGKRFCTAHGTELSIFEPENKRIIDNGWRKILHDEYSILYGDALYFGCITKENEYIGITKLQGDYSSYFTSVHKPIVSYFIRKEDYDRSNFLSFQNKIKSAIYKKYNIDLNNEDVTKTDNLRNRLGTYSTNYFTDFIYNGVSYPLNQIDYSYAVYRNGLRQFHDYRAYAAQACEKICMNENLRNYGYETIKDSFVDGWKIESQKSAPMSLNRDKDVRLDNEHFFIKYDVDFKKSEKFATCSCESKNQVTLKK